MTELLQQFLNNYLQLTIHDNVTLTAIVTFLIAMVVIMAMRLGLNLTYQAQYALFKLCAKEVKSSRDIKDAKSMLLNRAVKEYIKSAERGVDNIDTSTVVSMYVNKLNMVILNCRVTGRFVSSMEYSIPAIAFILALFTEPPMLFGVLGIASFVITRFFAMLFDFAIVRDRLITEMTIYIEQEIGQHYSTRFPTMMHVFKLELKNIIEEQSETTKKSIEKLGMDIAGVLQLSVQEMAKTIDTTMQNITDSGEMFKEPVEMFNRAIEKGTNMQENMNMSFEGISKASEQFNETISTLGSTFTAQNDYLTQHSESIYAQVEELKKVTQQLIDSNANSKNMIKDVEKAIKYIDKNQDILKNSLHSYEVALEQMTSNIGDGFGSIIQYQMEATYSKFDESIQNNINVIAKSNSEITKKLKVLFEQLQEQSKNETQAIVRVYEQMDMHFGKRDE